MVGRTGNPAPGRRARRQRATPKRPIRRHSETPPVALTIAGSDSSAGAGIQADLKTFSALGVYGVTAVSCVVAEVPGKVSRIEPVGPAMVREQIEVLARNFRITAAKTGLLCSAEIVSAVANAMRRINGKFASRIPVVIDPVIVATSGDPLLEPTAVDNYKKELFPLATLITPNLNEAETLLAMRIYDDESMRCAGKELEKQFRTAILLKGGHLRGDHAIDLLFNGGKVIEFSAPFVRGVAAHGTGCTYSAAITAALARGLSLEEAIRTGKKFVTKSIARHFRWHDLRALNHSI